MNDKDVYLYLYMRPYLYGKDNAFF